VRLQRGRDLVGYGLVPVELGSGQQSPIPATAIRWLGAVFALGAVGRLLLLVVAGPPHWFQVPLIVLEVVLPPVFFWLAPADERAWTERAAARR